MLEISNLSKTFDGLQAVRGFTLTVEPGKISSLIGPNGAGKTTVFNIATGFLSATSGDVLFKGNSLLNQSPWQIVQLGISRTFQNLRLFKKLTVTENVLLGIQHQSGEKFFKALLSFSFNSAEYKSQIERVNSLLEFVGLADDRDELAENLSYGQQKLLSIACCLATDPKILLLDEPVSGVQPAMIERVYSILKDLVLKQEKTVFLIEHDIDFVLKISDVVVVMDEGKKMSEGPARSIKRDAEILEAYLS